jgi:acyl-homoserine lactone synthase
MIHIVTAENRHLFHHALMEMHRQRKRLFVDEMGWPLEEVAGVEIDAFDCPEAIYLIEVGGPRGVITGSVRLLPTDRPHLLSEVFSHLCAGPLPRGAGVWEATRLCPAPDLPKGEPRRALLMRMIAAILEASLLFGIDRVTFVANAALAPLAIGAGWKVEALGGRQQSGRDRLRAFVADVDALGLRQVRIRNGITAPLTRFVSDSFAKAA